MNPDFARPGAIEFAEVDGLPSPQGNRPVLEKHALFEAHQARLDVGRRVPFIMGVAAFSGDKSLERRDDVPHHIGVGYATSVLPAIGSCLKF